MAAVNKHESDMQKAHASFSLSSTAIVPEALYKRMSNDKAGALVTFDGRVRNHNEGHCVVRLEYEAYEELALSEGNKIVEEALKKFDVYQINCVHRTGMLEIGDVAVWVGVLSAHRDAAFQACRYVIDEIKLRVPIWKNEHYLDGSSGWVSCHHHHDDARSRHQESVR
jgi:molybdopterin synthase catalytic subunit